MTSTEAVHTSSTEAFREHCALIPLLLAAADLGALAALRSGVASGEELGRHGLHPRAARLLLDVLHAFDLVERHPDGRLVASAALLRLEEALPGGLSFHARLAAHLPGFLRTGGAALADVDDPGRRPAFYAEAAGSLSALWRREAEALAAALVDLLRRERPDALGESLRFLDAGCGAGVWGLALLGRFPRSTLVGVDLPLVLPAFIRAAEAAAARPRVVAVPADLFVDDLPGGFDVVLVANVLRLEGGERAAFLLDRLARALKPGGRLVVVDALAAGDPSADRMRALYAVNLALRSERGVVHSSADLQALLERAGLTEVEPIRLPLGPGALGALSARRSGP
jgi:C-methyltransferase